MQRLPELPPLDCSLFDLEVFAAAAPSAGSSDSHSSGVAAAPAAAAVKPEACSAAGWQNGAHAQTSGPAAGSMGCAASDMSKRWRADADAALGLPSPFGAW